MHRLNELGRKFEGTGSYEFANYDQPNLLVYVYDKAFVKNSVYKAVVAFANLHNCQKDHVICFLMNFQKIGITPDDTFVHSIYLQSLFNDFIEGLIDELKIVQLGGQPFA